MMLCLFPRCLDSHKDILLTEDFAGFEIDLFVRVKEGEVVFVGMLTIVEVLTEVGGIEEEFVDVVSEF